MMSNKITKQDDIKSEIEKVFWWERPTYKVKETSLANGGFIEVRKYGNNRFKTYLWDARMKDGRPTLDFTKKEKGDKEFTSVDELGKYIWDRIDDTFYQIETAAQQEEPQQ